MAKPTTPHDRKQPIPPPRVPVHKPTVAQRRATIQRDDAAAREAAETDVRRTAARNALREPYREPAKKRVPLSVVLAVCVLALVVLAVVAYIFSQGGPPQ